MEQSGASRRLGQARPAATRRSASSIPAQDRQADERHPRPRYRAGSGHERNLLATRQEHRGQLRYVLAALIGLGSARRDLLAGVLAVVDAHALSEA